MLSSGINYKGSWNPSTNTPTIVDGVGKSGDFYIASTSGTVNLGSGDLVFEKDDWALQNASLIWQVVPVGQLSNYEVGNIDSAVPKSVNALTIDNNSNLIIMQTADATYPGVVSTGTQVFSGEKTFNDGLVGDLTGTSTGIAGGLANQILYQSAPGITDFIVAPVTPNTVLEWDGTGFTWGTGGGGGGFENVPWTPTDASGAGLSLTSSGAIESQTDNCVSFTATIQYPVTADTSQASITGLSSPATQNSFFYGATQDGIAVYARMVGSDILLYDIQRNPLTNAILSGKTIELSFTYQVAGSGTFVNVPWAASDASGAGLALTSTGAIESKSGNCVTFTGQVEYPVTADTSLAAITGLSLPVDEDSYFYGATQDGVALYLQFTGSDILIFDIQRNRLTNQDLSGTILELSFTYQT